MEPAVSTAMTRAAVSRERPDMWDVVRSDVAGFGDDDYRRRRAGVNAQRSRIDDSHPATLLRLRLLEAVPPVSARVVLDGGATQSLNLELKQALDIAARRAGERIRYRR
jgi:hypothetical protein